MALQLNIKTIRRKALQAWVNANGVPRRERSYFSQLLTGTSFGERAARRIEAEYDMGAGYLDRPLDGTAPTVEALPTPYGVDRIARLLIGRDRGEVDQITDAIEILLSASRARRRPTQK